MRLVIDASTLVAESLRVRGREFLANASLDLVIAAEAWNEADYELAKRLAILVESGGITSAESGRIQSHVQTLLDDRLSITPSHLYQDYVAEATWRIPRDPSDAPSVALALALECGIWTNDRDFFGCGLPVWVTETLRRHVDEQRFLLL